MMLSVKYMKNADLSELLYNRIDLKLKNDLNLNFSLVNICMKTIAKKEKMRKTTLVMRLM